MMVKAGPAKDAVINEVSPFLEEGDLLIDGGNSEFSVGTSLGTAL